VEEADENINGGHCQALAVDIELAAGSHAAAAWPFVGVRMSESCETWEEEKIIQETGESGRTSVPNALRADDTNTKVNNSTRQEGKNVIDQFTWLF
jgi:hypothetical protein